MSPHDFLSRIRLRHGGAPVRASSALSPSSARNTVSLGHRASTLLRASVLLAASALTLAGCATPASNPSDGASPGTTASSDHTGTAASPHSSDTTGTATLSGGWAKVGELGGMSGVFGTLTNQSGHDLTITRVTSPVAGMVELHEVTSNGVMREIAGPVVVPAGGALEFAPGATHVMLMQLQQALLPGDEVTLTFTFDDGSTAPVTVLVKDFAGANENYAGDGMDTSHGSH